ncbi:D-aminoacyl-tRNA deacylase [Aureliella helgolandensis]|uniref:D-aminoacyl-tRNA deacylase n=1 Tax=Aureliella helgolandensis TaxID=2527968 RepID=A0A518GFA7_9BACT|nr:D-aminoacyl-tRNA deacylase [Aureliella helgolandensis]QDV27285.1 D-tyrosyl-tRNA(Tyr) deacylase [Aureliella helgolandensis]
MRAVVQRVTEASVTVDEQVVGAISSGLLVLLGVEQGDADDDLKYLVNKTAGLRIFPDEQGLMNHSVQDIEGSVLVISQFTLFGDVRRGRRPSFTSAAEPTHADQLYLKYCQQLEHLGINVARGKFQADMQVALVNDGPVTILLDSRKLF